MSALGVGLWILISSTSTITDSRPPLSDEELQLLQSIEAEQIDVEEAEKPEGAQIEDDSYESLGRRAVQDWRSWAATLTENLAASDLAVRWTRDEPGHLKPVVKGQATHRSLTTLDGLPIRTMFDGVNELGAAVLFDPQTVSGPQLTDSRLQLRRGGAHLVASSKTGIESWLTSGSYLRDYGAGIGFGHRTDALNVYGQVAASQPATGYLTAEQDTVRFNGHLRTSSLRSPDSSVFWGIGVDLDEVQDFVRWELDSNGRAIEKKRSRTGGFGRWGFTGKVLDVDILPFYYRYLTEQEKPRQSPSKENVHQLGMNVMAAAKVSSTAKIGVQLQGEKQVGEHGDGDNLNSADFAELKAGLSAYVGNTLDRNTARSFFKARIGYAFGEQMQDQQDDRFRYLYGSLAGAYQLFNPLTVFGSIEYSPQFPTLKDRMRGAAGELEHLIQSTLGFATSWRSVALTTEFYSNQYTNLRMFNPFDSGVKTLEDQLDLGSLVSICWNISENFEIRGSNGLERTNSSDYHFRRLRLVYRRRQEGLLAEASVSQWSNTTLWTSLAFEAPFLDKHFLARLLLENIQDYQSFRPDSSIPEPELNLRLFLKATW